MAKSKAAIAEESRLKKMREKNKTGLMSFFDKYIAGRKTKNKVNAKTRVNTKTKTMSEKNATQMSKIAKNAKSVGSSQTDSQMSAKARKDAIAKLMKRVNTPTPKGVSQGSSASKSPKSSLGYPKVSQGSTTAKKQITKKTPIVTKAQLAKSGLSLRDYMNMLKSKATGRTITRDSRFDKKKKAKGANT